jgi:hypothetical protein
MNAVVAVAHCPPLPADTPLYHLGVRELRRLQSLEDENGRLKRLVATCRSTSTF